MMRLARRLAPSLAALGIALASVAGVEAQGGAAPFTPEERRKLVAGELVRRPITRSEGDFHYIGGTSWQRVDAPPERVWREVLDVSNYPRLIPGCDEARLEEDDGDRRLIYLHHSYAFVSASYYAHVRIDRDRRLVRFDLDTTRPHDVRAGRGFLEVDGYRDGSILTWGVMADVGAGLLTGILGPLLRDWILKVPTCVRGHMDPDLEAC